MMALISGGSGSGKSEVAEGLAVRLSKGNGLVYMATMEPFGDEALKRVRRHRLLREGKGFSTVEAYTDVHTVSVGRDSTVLLECLSNLLANETFSENPPSNAYDKVLMEVNRLKDSCKHLVVVSNEVFSDGCQYDATTLEYVKTLARLNRSIASLSDVVVECVYGNTIVYKGELS